MILHMTPGERATLQWLAEGRDSKEIALELGLTERAVESALAGLFARMGARTPAEAVTAAFSRGLLCDASATSPEN